MVLPDGACCFTAARSWEKQRQRSQVRSHEDFDPWCACPLPATSMDMSGGVRPTVDECPLVNSPVELDPSPRLSKRSKMEEGVGRASRRIEPDHAPGGHQGPRALRNAGTPSSVENGLRSDCLALVPGFVCADWPPLARPRTGKGCNRQGSCKGWPAQNRG